MWLTIPFSPILMILRKVMVDTEELTTEEMARTIPDISLIDISKVTLLIFVTKNMTILISTNLFHLLTHIITPLLNLNNLILLQIQISKNPIFPV